jgi:hypothetical protein
LIDATFTDVKGHVKKTKSILKDPKI